TFEKRVGLPERLDCGVKRSLVRKEGPVGNNGRLQKLPYNHRIVGPVDPERRIDYRQQDLELYARRHAHLLRSGRDFRQRTEVSLRKLRIQRCDTIRLHRKLAGPQDLIHTRVGEQGQRYRTDDRDAVFEVADQLRVAARRDELVHRNLHRLIHGLHHAVDHHLLRTRAAIGVEDVDGSLARNECEGTDPPNIESADILFTADVGAGKWRRYLAAISGQHGSHPMERQNVVLLPRTRLEILRIDGRPDRIYVTAQDTAGELCCDKQAASASGVDWVIDRVVRKRRCNGAGLDTRERGRAGNALKVNVIKIGLRCCAVRIDGDAGVVVPVRDADAREAAAQRIAGRNRKPVPVRDVVDEVTLAQRVEQR